MTIDDPRSLEPGTVLQYRPWDGPTRYSLVTLSHRKDDDSGWWNTDGSGLADWVLAEGDDWATYEPPASTTATPDRAAQVTDTGRKQSPA